MATRLLTTYAPMLTSEVTRQLIQMTVTTAGKWINFRETMMYKIQKQQCKDILAQTNETEK